MGTPTPPIQDSAQLRLHRCTPAKHESPSYRKPSRSPGHCPRQRCNRSARCTSSPPSCPLRQGCVFPGAWITHPCRRRRSKHSGARCAAEYPAIYLVSRSGGRAYRQCSPVPEGSLTAQGRGLRRRRAAGPHRALGQRPGAHECYRHQGRRRRGVRRDGGSTEVDEGALHTREAESTSRQCLS